MKRFFILLILVINFSPKINSQIDELIDVGVNLIQGAIELHYIMESLELQATNHVISLRPDAKSFRVKVINFDNVKADDVSQIDVIAFAIVHFDIETYAEKERNILLMYTSPNWITAAGVEVSLIKWQELDRLFWNELYNTYVDMITPISMQNGMAPLIEKIDELEFDANNNNHIIISNLNGKIDYYNIFEYSYPSSMLIAENSGFNYDKRVIEKTSGRSNAYRTDIIPSYKLRGDDYIIENFDEHTILVYNEKTLGIFDKRTKEQVQFPLATVNQINWFLNKQNDEVILGTSIQSGHEKRQETLSKQKAATAAAKELSNKRSQFNLEYVSQINNPQNGVEGIMKLNERITWEDFFIGNWTSDEIVSFEIVDTKDLSSNKPLIRISYFDKGKQQEKWVKLSNDYDKLKFKTQ